MSSGWIKAKPSNQARRSISGSRKSAVARRLREWQLERKKQAADRFNDAVTEFKYCVGQSCRQGVKDFCRAAQLDEPTTVQLMNFIRYAREKGVIDYDVSASSAKMLCDAFQRKINSAR